MYAGPYAGDVRDKAQAGGVIPGWASRAMRPGIQCKIAHVPPYEAQAAISCGINNIVLNNVPKTVKIAGG
jgi:hypothetical protein